jgi:NAD(P)-dependent dehydrogenase (short-subunit alcohol dehydrogenase family)
VLKEHGDQAVADLSAKYGVPVVFHQVDVRNHKSVQDAVDATVQQFGKIDVLVASAGIAE